MNQKRVEKMVRFWQKRLRLQDWRVRVRYRRLPKGDDDCEGLTWLLPKLKMASIKINKFSKKRAHKKDPTEVTVIHELIHLHLSTWEHRNMGKARYANYEASIDCLAWGLYMARYPGARDRHVT